MNGDPRKEQRNAGIRLDVSRFAAAEISEEDESLLIKGFQENHALPWSPVLIYRGQRHGVRLNDL